MVKDQVSHPYKKGNIIALYISILNFLDRLLAFPNIWDLPYFLRIYYLYITILSYSLVMRLNSLNVFFQKKDWSSESGIPQTVSRNYTKRPIIQENK